MINHRHKTFNFQTIDKWFLFGEMLPMCGSVQKQLAMTIKMFCRSVNYE